MNKKFFKGMEAFAGITLVLGIIGAVIMFFVTAISWKNVGYIYSNYEPEIELAGLMNTIQTLFTTFVFYYLLKAGALIGQMLCEKDDLNKPTFSTLLVTPDDIKTTDGEDASTQVDETMKAQQEESNNR